MRGRRRRVRERRGAGECVGEGTKGRRKGEMVCAASWKDGRTKVDGDEESVWEGRRGWLASWGIQVETNEVEVLYLTLGGCAIGLFSVLISMRT